MKRQSGFTLIEILLSLVLTVIVLGAMTSIFTGSGTVYRSEAARADASQSLSAGLSLLSYELGLAGYRGTDFSLDTLSSHNFNNQPTLQISKANSSDSITVRYYEDRWTANGAVELVQVKFEVRDNNLYRIDLSSNTEQEVAAGISSIRANSYINPQGSKLAVTSQLDLKLVQGLIITLTYDNKQTQDMAIGFRNSLQPNQSQSSN